MATLQELYVAAGATLKEDGFAYIDKPLEQFKIELYVTIGEMRYGDNIGDVEPEVHLWCPYGDIRIPLSEIRVIS